MTKLRRITLSASILFFFTFITLPQQTKACSCIFAGSFCESITSISDHVSLVVITDSIDWNKRSAVVLENIQTEMPQGTFVLKGGNGADCGENMNQFNIGDTLLVGLEANSDLNYSLYICGTYFLAYTNGILRGNIFNGDDFMEYEAFKDTFEECLATSGVVKELQRSLSIFPNPASTEINISLTSFPFNLLELYDITGKLIIKERSNGDLQTQLDISELSSGVYLLKVFVGEIYVTRKIMVF